MALLDIKKLKETADNLNNRIQEEKDRKRREEIAQFNSKVKAIMDSIPAKAEAAAKQGRYRCSVITLRATEDYPIDFYSGRITYSDLRIKDLIGVVAEVAKKLSEEGLKPYIDYTWLKNNDYKFNLMIKWD